MKNLTFLLLIFTLLLSCKKNEYGNVKQQIKGINALEKRKKKSIYNKNDLKYSQFGDFIMTVTPDSFIGNIKNARYFDNSTVMAYGSIILFGPEVNTGYEGVTINFSNSSTIPVTPFLTGNMPVNENGESRGFFKEDVTFDLFYIGLGIEMVISLPSKYTGITLDQFKDSSAYYLQNGLEITTNQSALNKPIDTLKLFNVEQLDIYFGRTNTTYITVGNNPQQGFGNPYGASIRSTKFESWTLTPPAAGQTKTILSVLGFNSDNIIQIYAGTDNIPYTKDDIIVFEPKFWERIFLYVEINEN